MNPTLKAFFNRQDSSVSFRDMDDVVERMKDVLSHQVEGYVYDKDVAAELKMDRSALYCLKKKNDVPYLAVFKFCQKHNVSVASMLLKNSTVSS